VPRFCELLGVAAEEVLELGELAPLFSSRVAVAIWITNVEDDCETELEVAELVTFCDADSDEEELLEALDELLCEEGADDEARLLEELVGDGETLADDETLAELDDVDCAPTGPVPVETM
jgi:hypothetical protein